jgi:hypothetical protein
MFKAIYQQEKTALRQIVIFFNREQQQGQERPSGQGPGIGAPTLWQKKAMCWFLKLIK